MIFAVAKQINQTKPLERMGISRSHSRRSRNRNCFSAVKWAQAAL